MEYREFVWAAVNRLPAKDGTELATQVEVNRKLKALGHELRLSKEDQEAVDAGELRYPGYTTYGPVDLVIEDEEWRWLKDRLRKYIPLLTGFAGEDFQALLTKVDGAEKFDAAPRQQEA
jgi:hypothetical protein